MKICASGVNFSCRVASSFIYIHRSCNRFQKLKKYQKSGYLNVLEMNDTIGLHKELLNFVRLERCILSFFFFLTKVGISWLMVDIMNSRLFVPTMGGFFVIPHRVGNIWTKF